MRKYILSLILAVLTFIASSQSFTYQPIVGVDNSITKISYDQPGSFQKLKSFMSPSVGLRMDYRFKQGSGPYLGIMSSRPSVEYVFTNPNTGKTSYTTSAGDMQVQFQAGYQLSTKKILLNKASASNNSKTSSSSCGNKAKAASTASKSCGQKVIKHCGSNGSSKASQYASRTKHNVPFLRILPSAGIAYRPFIDQKVETEVSGSKTEYEYAVGGTKMALNTGIAFEFGKGSQKTFTISLNYFKGLGNNEQTLTTAPDLSKPTLLTTTKLASQSSGWNASIGFPISFSTKKKSHHSKAVKVVRTNCIQIKKSCGGN